MLLLGIYMILSFLILDFLLYLIKDCYFIWYRIINLNLRRRTIWFRKPFMTMLRSNKRSAFSFLPDYLLAINFPFLLILIGLVIARQLIVENIMISIICKLWPSITWDQYSSFLCCWRRYKTLGFTTILVEIIILSSILVCYVWTRLVYLFLIFLSILNSILILAFILLFSQE